MTRLTPAVMRALDILELFAADISPLSLAELTVKTGLPKTSLYEITQTLLSRGYLVKDDNGSFLLGPATSLLGTAYIARAGIVGAINDTARELAQRTGETVSVGYLSGSEVLYLAKIEIRDFQVSVSSVGRTLPAHCTGLGKALLATLSDDELAKLYPNPSALPVMTENSLGSLPDLLEQLQKIRQTGVSYDLEESMLGLCCTASTAEAMVGQSRLAMSISVPKLRFTLQQREHWAGLVTEAADALATKITALPESERSFSN